jgi:hypothetical protein
MFFLFVRRLVSPQGVDHIYSLKFGGGICPACDPRRGVGVECARESIPKVPAARRGSDRGAQKKSKSGIAFFCGIEVVLVVGNTFLDTF